jgi:hypothetical protein
MTKDDIARMAQEAGFAEKYGYVTALVCIDRFANLVAAAEREACARMCNEADKSTHPADLAAAIQARGNT